MTQSFKVGDRVRFKATRGQGVEYVVTSVASADRVVLRSIHAQIGVVNAHRLVEKVRRQ